MQPSTSPAELNLENCDREPIHIPGSIQPHGALLAFDRLGRLSHASANVPALLGIPLEFGRTLRPGAFGDDAALEQLLQDTLADANSDELVTNSLEATLRGSTFDIVLHAQHGRVICEFERRAAAAGEVSTFAHLAYRAMDTLKRQRSIERLLDAAVIAVRQMTGFDRVMAYRFGHDDSGDVVAEACSDALEPYLGRRYPASDIPAQARRLYILNTLRLIADVGYEPVPLLADATQREPLDLSHSVLRSVSPIHIEYMKNMGMGASMSVSIVIGGRLWGMLACHHMAPLQVPYPIRMAVDVMAQVIASTVQSLAAKEREGAIARAAWLRTEIVRAIAVGGEVGEVVMRESPALRENLGCDALLVTLGGIPRAADHVHAAWAKALATWLAQHGDAALVHVFHGEQLPPPLPGQPEDERYCGVLALRFDAPRQGWIVGLRREVVQTIRWGGKPEKVIAHGPLGPRLTPRGSFAEWRETVRGQAEPWNDVELEIASQLLDSVGRAYADRVLEIDQLRSQLWAVLGHDLRNPLQSLSMANSAIERGGQSERLNSVIRSSTHRMKQLLGDVLDISRLHHGFDLTMQWSRVDLVAVIRQLVEESHVAYPGISLDVSLPGSLVADADEGRYTQVVANLLSNARHHGQGRIVVTAREEDGLAVVSITNDAPPIPEDILVALFDPFKRQSAANERNRTGMGLGLYIAHEVVRGHQGTLVHIGGDGTVTFEARIPLRRAPG
ncbi:ATP-binding protein [Scleromatobacter humisilvae]|uniref:histidine kinase n=1 Tax=Scleromatobacter humisilvae TaxID=2897159 RepID=A0A9X1YK12_9BURK|nr:ATP-binding protein [Scleromatobacter humisilvae]MCK9686248.1 GAF domain-containing protein [Scleromatobacter humisilvae]